VPPVRRAPATAASVVAAIVLCLVGGAGSAPAQPAAEPQLSVAPIPTDENPKPGTPMVTWTTGDGSPGLVTVVTAGGADATFASAPSGSAEAPWVVAGNVYEFRLYSTASGRKLLARLKVGRDAAAKTEVLAPLEPPRDTPEAVDRLLQVLPFAGLVVLGLLTMSFVREMRRDG
jgi:hypothetical protein